MWSGESLVSQRSALMAQTFAAKLFHSNSVAITRGMTEIHTAEYDICTPEIFSSKLSPHLKNRCGEVCSGWGREDTWGT